VLVDGRPQSASVPRDAMAYFSFTVRNADDISFDVAPSQGVPALYVATGSGARPSPVSASSFTWSTADASRGLHLTPGEPGFCASCTYVVGVVGATDTAFSITATRGGASNPPGTPPSPPPPALLQNGVPFTANVPKGKCRGFTWVISSATAAPVLFVTPFHGSPTIYANFQPASAPLALPTPTVYGDQGWPNAKLDVALDQLELAIPPLYVRSHVGAYNVLACTSAAVGTQFALTALADTDSATQLVAGRSQQAAVSQNSWRFFRLSTPRSARKLSVSTTLISGAIDVHLMSSGRTATGSGSSGGGTRPSRTPADYTWTARGGESIVLTTSSVDFCAGCTYTVGVRGATRASSFSLLFTLDDGPVSLQRGIATSFQTTATNEALAFTFVVDAPIALTIAVTPMAGDPNVYVSTSPDALAQPVWSSTLAGQTDVIRIPPTDAGFALGVYYIVVKDRDGGACSFSVLVSTDTVRLADGQPQNTALPRGEWAYFTFVQPSVADGAGDILISVIASVGDPDVYVSAAAERPTAMAYGWKSTVSGTDQLVISTTDTGYCAGCVYTIGVHAFSSTNFTITAQSALGTQRLQLGVPALGLAGTSANGGIAPSYFEFAVELTTGTAAPSLELLLTPHGGSFMLGLSTTEPRPLFSSLPRPAVSAAAGDPAARLSLAPSDVAELCTLARQTTSAGAKATDSCSFFVAVQAVAAQGSFTLVACRGGVGSGGPGCLTQLFQGSPQASVVAKDAYRRFKLAADDGVDFSVTVTPTPLSSQAEVDLYIGTSPAVDSSHYGWKSEARGADTVLIAAGSEGFCGACTYYVAVLGRTAANFSIVSSTSTGHTTLLPRTPVKHELAAGAFRYYTVPRQPPSAQSGSRGVDVALEACYGAATLYGSQSRVKPDRTHFQMAASAGDRPYIHLPAASLALKPVYVAVYGVANAEYVIRMGDATGSGTAGGQGGGNGGEGTGGLGLEEAEDGEHLIVNLPPDSSATTSYELYVAADTAGVIFTTPCGVSRSGTLVAKFDAASAAAAAGRFTIAKPAWPAARLNVLARPRGREAFVYTPLPLDGKTRPDEEGGSFGTVVLYLLLVVGCLAGSGWLMRQWRAGQAPITQALRPVRARLAPVNTGTLLTGTRRQREEREMSTNCLFQPMLTAPLASIPPLNPLNAPPPNAMPPAAGGGPTPPAAAGVVGGGGGVDAGAGRSIADGTATTVAPLVAPASAAQV